MLRIFCELYPFPATLPLLLPQVHFRKETGDYISQRFQHLKPCRNIMPTLAWDFSGELETGPQENGVWRGEGVRVTSSSLAARMKGQAGTYLIWCPQHCNIISDAAPPVHAGSDVTLTFPFSPSQAFCVVKENQSGRTPTSAGDLAPQGRSMGM